MGPLREMIDPELGSDIVELGMARSATVDPDGVVLLEKARTTGGCPPRAQIQKDIRSRLETLPGITRVKINRGELTPAEKQAGGGTRCNGVHRIDRHLTQVDLSGADGSGESVRTGGCLEILGSSLGGGRTSRWRSNEPIRSSTRVSLSGRIASR